MTFPSGLRYRERPMQLKERILGAAVALAKREGLRRFVKADIARAVWCGTGSINYHFSTMDKLRVAVIDHAIKHEIVEILAQARAERHPRLIGRLTPALKERVAQHIAGK